MERNEVKLTIHYDGQKLKKQREALEKALLECKTAMGWRRWTRLRVRFWFEKRRHKKAFERIGKTLRGRREG